MSPDASTPTPQTPRPQTAEMQRPQQLSHAPQAPAKREQRVVPIGTLVIIGFLLLNIVFLWMLVLGVQQGRA